MPDVILNDGRASIFNLIFMKTFIFVLWIFTIGCWIGNLMKLTQCDFQAPVKCEIVHGIGIFWPLSLVTVWVWTDE